MTGSSAQRLKALVEIVDMHPYGGVVSTGNYLTMGGITVPFLSE